MDIDLLSKMVKELILDNDKVVLPGLGSFVAEVVLSTFSDKGYTINPPYRKLYFRSKPDDGQALVDFYAESNRVDREIAEKVICDFVKELKEVLFTRKTVVFPGLGRLRATKENHVFFVADEDLDIYPEGLALDPISLKTHVETQEEVQTVMEELKAIVDETALPTDHESAVPEPAPESVVPEQIEQKDSEIVTLPVEETAPVEETEPTAVEEPVNKSGFWRTFIKIFLIMLLTTALLLAAFVIFAHCLPEVVDKILYTPEELEILNR